MGAGPAGLTAGYELVKKGYQVTIVEKDPDYVGGISRTVQYKDYRFDIGGHRFFSKNQQVVDWWFEIMGDDFLKRPRISRWLYKRKFFNYPINIFEVLAKFGPVFALRVGTSLVYRKLFPVKEETNLDAWFRNNFGDFLAKPFFINYNQKLWGMPCTQLSIDFAGQRIKGISVMTTVLESLKNLLHMQGSVKSFIQEFYYPKYGPGELWERVAEAITARGGQILMGHEVRQLSASDGRIQTLTVKADGKEKTFQADYFLSTIPYKELAQEITPALPEDVIAAAQALKFRDFITVALVIKKDFITRDTWVYTHDEDMSPIRFQNFKNWSPYMIPNADECVVGMEYTCNVDDDFWSMSDEDLKQQGMRDFLKLGFASREEIVDAAVVRMKNVYPVYELGYDKHVVAIRTALEKYPNLYAFGRGGIHRYNNSDHSMMTAFLTVKNIEAGERRYDVFKVNNDAEYHEERP